MMNVSLYYFNKSRMAWQKLPWVHLQGLQCKLLWLENLKVVIDFFFVVVYLGYLSLFALRVRSFSFSSHRGVF